MSLAVLHSRALSGVHAPPVEVEVHLANGLPNFCIVGLPEAEVKESRDRVRAAIQTSQFEFPLRRITVNLAPADLPKESGRYDLPIALGILAASGQIPNKGLDQYEIAGELALTGELRPVYGALAMAIGIYQSNSPHRARRLILPQDCAAEACLIEQAHILPAQSLLQVCAHLKGRQTIQPMPHQAPVTQANLPDFREVKGQLFAKRALEVAAAGGHSVLMSGPPGTGKSMLASRFASILPLMSEQETLESAAIQSLNGQFKPSAWGLRPYRAPHHTASAVALVGGGGTPRPGEISLAHNGVLFLDELPEFDRKVLEVLREPLESGHITISRAARQADFPARFQLIAAMNPCPCGYLAHHNNRCRCTPDKIHRYRAKISGPLLDRIDIHIEVASLKQDDLMQAADGEASAQIQARVQAAYEQQLQRQQKSNYALSTQEIEQFCRADAASMNLLKQAIQKFNLSARAFHRILKVARTIADLGQQADIQTRHIAEAIQYRRNESIRY